LIFKKVHKVEKIKIKKSQFENNTLFFIIFDARFSPSVLPNTLSGKWFYSIWKTYFCYYARTNMYRKRKWSKVIWRKDFTSVTQRMLL